MSLNLIWPRSGPERRVDVSWNCRYQPYTECHQHVRDTSAGHLCNFLCKEASKPIVRDFAYHVALGHKSASSEAFSTSTFMRPDHLSQMFSNVRLYPNIISDICPNPRYAINIPTHVRHRIMCQNNDKLNVTRHLGREFQVLNLCNPKSVRQNFFALFGLFKVSQSF